MRWAGVAGIATGGAALALAGLLALAPSPARLPRPSAPPADPGLEEAIAQLSGESPPLPREYATAGIDVAFQPLPEPGTGALVALGLTLLPRLARSRAACHPAR
jgi:hypothetical protein